MSKLFQRFIEFSNFRAAAIEVGKGKQTHPQYVLMLVSMQRHLIILIMMIKDRTWSPSGVYRFVIREPKRREISAPNLRDRIVHHALIRVTLCYFERYFCDCSFACRKGKEVITATITMKDGSVEKRQYKAGHHYSIGYYYSKLRKELKDDIITEEGVVSVAISREKGRGSIYAVYYWQELIRKAIGKFGTDFYVISIDMKSFFKNISHPVLKHMIRVIIKDKDMLWIWDKVIDSFEEEEGRGIPIGFLTSQHCANLIGSIFDHFVKDILGIKVYIRYMDDLRIAVKTREEAKSTLYELDALAYKAGLILSPKKTRIDKWKGRDTFCGFVVRPHCLSPKKAALDRACRRLKKQREYIKGGYMTEEQFYSSAMNAKTYLSRTDHPEDERIDRWLSK